MVSFAGLGSGIDFGAITEQLVRLERLPISNLESSKSGANRKIALVSDFATRVRALETAAKDLDAPSKVRAVKATTTDEERVKVSASGAAQLGTFDFSVTALARAQTNQSRTFSEDAAGVLGVGSLDITVGDGETATFEFDADDSLSSFARRLNDANLGVRASVLFDGTNHRLLISGEETGADNAVTFFDPGDSLGLTDVGNELTSARDAQFTVAGVPVTRSSNTLTDVIEGVTFELVSETPAGQPSTQVSVSRDPDGLATKVESFVKALNEVQSFVNGQLSNTTASPNDSLRSDSMLQGFQRRFGMLLSSAHGPDGSSLGRFGIKVDRTGTVTLERAKLDEAIASEPDGLARMLAGTAGDGMVAAMTALTTDYTRSGDGILAGKQTSLRSRITGWDGQIERIESKASALESRLTRQFGSTDTTIALLNSQSSFIASILAAAY